MGADVTSSAEPTTLRFTVGAAHVRQLARRRVALALGTLPVLILVGFTVLAISLSLMLIAVLCGFFAYACASIAARQRRGANEAVDLEFALEGDRLLLPGQEPRRITRVIDRPGYVRLRCTHERVAAFWLDARRDPSAFLDVPLPRAEREPLHRALRAEGIVCHREGSAVRVLSLGAALVVTFGAFVIVRGVLKLSATALVTAPTTWVVALVVILLATWIWRRTR